MHDLSSLRVSRFARLLLAACLIVGPVAGIVVRASVPASSTASAARSAIDYGRHTGATQLVLIADGFLFLLVPAALAATALAWRRAPLLSLLAGIFSLVGWTSIVMLAAQDALFAETGRAVYGSGDALRIATNWSGSALVTFYIGAFIVGHLVGTALLGAALWRARAVPRWAAVCVGVSMPLHLVAVLADVRIADVGCWVLLLLGFAACARALVMHPFQATADVERRVAAVAHA